MSQPLRALLVEDVYWVRETVRDYLVRRGVEVGEAGSLDEAMPVAEALQPDVAILDIVLPVRQGEAERFDQQLGVEVARRLRERFPDVGIVFLTSYPDRAKDVDELFKKSKGRMVYLLKASPPEDLWKAILRVLESPRPMVEWDVGVQMSPRTPYDVALETLTLEERSVIEIAMACLAELSPREREVFKVVGSCRTEKAAARQLSCTQGNVDFHKQAIYSKLHLQELPGVLNTTALLAKIHLLSELRRAENRTMDRAQEAGPS